MREGLSCPSALVVAVLDCVVVAGREERTIARVFPPSIDVE